MMRCVDAIRTSNASKGLEAGLLCYAVLKQEDAFCHATSQASKKDNNKFMKLYVPISSRHHSFQFELNLEFSTVYKRRSYVHHIIVFKYTIDRTSC